MMSVVDLYFGKPPHLDFRLKDVLLVIYLYSGYYCMPVQMTPVHNGDSTPLQKMLKGCNTELGHAMIDPPLHI